MIVVDSNAVAYYLIEGEHTALAHEVRRRDRDWLAPPIWRHEMLNILAMYALHGGMDAAVCQEVWDQALSLMRRGVCEVDMSHALGLAIENAISAYDAQFVELASNRNIPLVTQDRRLLTKFPELALSMREFVRD